jgi:hypothetical protein
VKVVQVVQVMQVVRDRKYLEMGPARPAITVGKYVYT